MSKKKKKERKKVIVHKHLNSSSKFSQEKFLSDLESQTRKTFQGMILPFEQRLDSLFEKLQNVKSNVVVSNSLLERKNIFTRDEFFAEFQNYQSNEVGSVDGSGTMDGNSVFSIYN